MFVIANHYFVWTAPYPVASSPEALQLVFATSDLGMTLFFTLSGFVITYNYFDFGWDRTPIRSFWRFAFLRFSRLYPALLVFIALLAIARISSDKPNDGLALWTAIHLLSAQTWAPFKWDGALPIDSAFHVSWSISTEFMLYFMFAIVAVLSQRLLRLEIRGSRAILLSFAGVYAFVGVSLCVSPRLLTIVTSWIGAPLEDLNPGEWKRWFTYLSPYSRVLEFSLGCFAAYLVMYRQPQLSRHRVVARTAAMIAILGICAIQALPYFPSMRGGYISDLRGLISAALFAIVMMNANDATRLNQILSLPALIFVGEISYSLYLFHALSPRYGIYLAVPFEWTLFPFHVINFVVSTFCAVIFAFGMYKLVEMPAQRALRRLIQLKVASANTKSAQLSAPHPSIPRAKAESAPTSALL